MVVLCCDGAHNSLIPDVTLAAGLICFRILSRSASRTLGRSASGTLGKSASKDTSMNALTCFCALRSGAFEDLSLAVLHQQGVPRWVTSQALSLSAFC